MVVVEQVKDTKLNQLIQLIHVRYNSQECYRKDINLLAEPFSTCSCKLLEVEGIVGAHIIAAYRVYLENLRWDGARTLKKVFVINILLGAMYKPLTHSTT